MPKMYWLGVKLHSNRSRDLCQIVSLPLLYNLFKCFTHDTQKVDPTSTAVNTSEPLHQMIFLFIIIVNFFFFLTDWIHRRGDKISTIPASDDPDQSCHNTRFQKRKNPKAWMQFRIVICKANQNQPRSLLRHSYESQNVK